MSCLAYSGTGSGKTLRPKRRIMSPGEAIRLTNTVVAQSPSTAFRWGFYHCNHCGYVHGGHRRPTDDERRATKRESRRRYRAGLRARKAKA